MLVLWRGFTALLVLTACVPAANAFVPLSAVAPWRLLWPINQVRHVVSGRMVSGQCGSGARVAGSMMQMSGWASPSWNWGSAVGDAHNEAMRVRSALRDDFEGGDVGAIRRAWLLSMIGGSSAVEWEDVKLVLALKWQKAAREGRDGGGKGYGYVMEQLRQGKYEDANDTIFVADMQARLDLLRGDAKDIEAIFMEAAQGPSIFKDSADADRRGVAARVLFGLDFIEKGL